MGIFRKDSQKQYSLEIGLGAILGFWKLGTHRESSTFWMMGKPEDLETEQENKEESRGTCLNGEIS